MATFSIGNYKPDHTYTLKFYPIDYNYLIIFHQKHNIAFMNFALWKISENVIVIDSNDIERWQELLMDENIVPLEKFKNYDLC